jgi:glycosyltransferase involved in cell wall biosynthesis
MSKIGVLIDRLNVGGVEKIAIEQVRALRKLGKDAHLVVLRRKGVVDNAFVDLRKNLPTIYLDDRMPGFLKYSFKFPIFSFFSSFHLTYPIFLPFFLRKKEFEYLIVHGTYTAFSAISFKKIKGINFSVFIWDPIGYILGRVYSQKLSFFLSIFKKLAKVLDKSIINNADFILVGGNAHNGYIKKINPRKKIKIIPPSVHPIKKLNKIKKDYSLIVTAWKKGKNPEYLFELIKQVPGLRIKMVGKWLDSIFRKEFEDKLRKEKLQDRLDIVGAVSESQLSKYYSEALVLLQTNDDRGFGMPALEAAGHGTTFIIPTGQGVCSLFKDNIDGFYTKEKDTRLIVTYLNKLISNKDLAIKMGHHAWGTVVNNNSWERHAELLIKIIKNEK